MKKLLFSLLLIGIVLFSFSCAAAQKPTVSKEQKEKIDRDKQDFENKNK
jgi:hypothetical protein